jgi:hypothetical protein
MHLASQLGLSPVSRGKIREEKARYGLLAMWAEADAEEEAAGRGVIGDGGDAAG